MVLSCRKEDSGWVLGENFLGLRTTWELDIGDPSVTDTLIWISVLMERGEFEHSALNGSFQVADSTIQLILRIKKDTGAGSRVAGHTYFYLAQRWATMAPWQPVDITSQNSWASTDHQGAIVANPDLVVW